VNIYIVVEGEVGEVQVYRKWVSYANSSLTYVDHISKMTHNNFSIISAGGIPRLYSVVKDAIADINNYANIDRLVISTDSEEMSYSEKYEEVMRHLSGLTCSAEIRIIIQHFCLETWGLGNRQAIRQHPQNLDLIKYMRLYNVRIEDPEMLPGYEEEGLYRSQFAAKYLKKAMNDKFRNLTYSKSNPTALLDPGYYNQVKRRLQETSHIASFNDFLQAFC
jgi:hypothetical protein